MSNTPTPRAIEFTYRNWRGETALRRVTPDRIWWGSTKWHPAPGWLLTGFDHDKGAMRDFALQDIRFDAEATDA